jgi:hypothetical protein
MLFAKASDPRPSAYAIETTTHPGPVLSRDVAGADAAVASRGSLRRLHGGSGGWYPPATAPLIGHLPAKLAPRPPLVQDVEGAILFDALRPNRLSHRGGPVWIRTAC